MKELELIKDVARIAKYLLWHSDVGDKRAQDIMTAVHNGKHGCKEGIWPEVDKAINALEELINGKD